MSVNYEDLDMGDLQDELGRVAKTAEKTNNGASKPKTSEFLKNFVKLPSDGYVTLRFLPRRSGQKLFCATRLHKLDTEINGKTYSRYYHCRRELTDTKYGKQWRGDCELCSYYSNLWKKSEGLSGAAQENMKNEARRYKPNERYYYNVLVRSQKGENGEIEKNVGPLIFSCGVKVHEKILRAINGDESIGETGLGNITHPLTGYDFKLIIKKTKGSDGQMYPNYDLSKFEDKPSALGTESEIEEWLSKLHDLQALRVLKSNDELSTALRISLGLEKPENSYGESSYDPSKYEMSGDMHAASVNVSATVDETLVNSGTVTKKNNNSTAVEEILADEDFMKELEG
jgi:hypothetical protein